MPDASPLTKLVRDRWASRAPLDADVRAGRDLPFTTETDALDVVRRRETAYRRALVVSDLVATCAALAFAISFLGDDQLRLTTLAFVPLVVLLAKLFGLYDRDELVIAKGTVDELPRLFQLVTLTAFVFYLLSFALINGVLGQGQALALWLTLGGTMACARAIARRLTGRRAAVERCLVVGDAIVLERLQGKLGGDHRVVLVGSVPLEHVVGDRMALRAAARSMGAHRLIVAASDGAVVTPETVAVIRGAKATGLRVSLLPGVLDVVGTSVVFDALPGLTLLGVRRFGLSRSSRMTKRALDLVGGVAALVVLSPLMAAIVVAIRLDSPGPTLFRQTRVGRDGRPFGILKFRSMVEGADAMRADLAEHNEARDGLFKIAADPRLTRVGAVLRRFSLDELPQLFNVLHGQMSLVGPRPLVVDEDARILGGDRQRLELTPGMTGEWQIAGSARVPLAEMVKMDYLYVAGWSLWSDIKILIRTVLYVAGARGQ